MAEWDSALVGQGCEVLPYGAGFSDIRGGLIRDWVGEVRFESVRGSPKQSSLSG